MFLLCLGAVGILNFGVLFWVADFSGLLFLLGVIIRLPRLTFWVLGGTGGSEVGLGFVGGQSGCMWTLPLVSPSIFFFGVTCSAWPFFWGFGGAVWMVFLSIFRLPWGSCWVGEGGGYSRFVQLGLLYGLLGQVSSQLS